MPADTGAGKEACDLSPPAAAAIRPTQQLVKPQFETSLTKSALPLNATSLKPLAKTTLLHRLPANQNKRFLACFLN